MGERGYRGCHHPFPHPHPPKNFARIPADTVLYDSENFIVLFLKLINFSKFKATFQLQILRISIKKVLILYMSNAAFMTNNMQFTGLLIYQMSKTL